MSDARSLAIYERDFRNQIPKNKQGKPFKSNKKFPEKPVAGKFYFDIDSDTLYYYDGKYNEVTKETLKNFLPSS